MSRDAVKFGRMSKKQREKVEDEVITSALSRYLFLNSISLIPTELDRVSE